MPAKTEQLQIRVSPAQKTALKRRARAAGMDVSTFVLARALPAERNRMAGLVAQLADGEDHRFALAELHNALVECVPLEFAEGVAALPVGRLSPHLANYVAAMVEQAAAQKGVSPPSWVRDVEPLEAPHFATDMPALRTHLLASSPVPFKRRNIFVDSTIGARV